MLKRDDFQIYEKLYIYYGPQYWWPAETTFEMMISAILVQNTNWKNVEKAIERLKPVFSPEKMADLPMEDLAHLIRPSGFYNIKAKRIKAFIDWMESYNYDLNVMKAVSKQGLRKELLQINGIGPETADCILLYALDKPVFVVDAYTRRIYHRVGYAIPKTYDAFQKEVVHNFPSKLPYLNEYHALLVEHAKTHCKVKPSCHHCPLLTICQYGKDIC